MIKLIASDLDDTLLDQNGRISPENKRVIREAVKQGLIFTLATGRMFQSAAPFARELELEPDLPLICYNGALIKRLSGEILYEQPLHWELAAEIAQYGQERGWTVQVYYQDKLHVAERNEDVEGYLTIANVQVYEVGDLAALIRDGGKSLSKILIISSVEDTPRRLDELRQIWGQKVEIASSRARFLEITNPAATKGAALQWLAEHLQIPMAQVMAIGDGNNDVSMVERAGFGVAVENASPKVKAVARSITSAHHADGVAKAISELVFNVKN